MSSEFRTTRSFADEAGNTITEPNKPLEPEDVKSVIPRLGFHSGIVSTNGFTIGKEYPVHSIVGRGVVVLNDNQHERFVCLDSGSSAHIMDTVKDLYGTRQHSAGYFEVVCK